MCAAAPRFDPARPPLRIGAPTSKCRSQSNGKQVPEPQQRQGDGGAKVLPVTYVPVTCPDRNAGCRENQELSRWRQPRSSTLAFAASWIGAAALDLAGRAPVRSGDRVGLNPAGAAHMDVRRFPTEPRRRVGKFTDRTRTRSEAEGAQTRGVLSFAYLFFARAFCLSFLCTSKEK